MIDGHLQHHLIIILPVKMNYHVDFFIKHLENDFQLNNS